MAPRNFIKLEEDQIKFENKSSAERNSLKFEWIPPTNISDKAIRGCFKGYRIKWLLINHFQFSDKNFESPTQMFQTTDFLFYNGCMEIRSANIMNSDRSTNKILEQIGKGGINKYQSRNVRAAKEIIYITGFDPVSIWLPGIPRMTKISITVSIINNNFEGPLSNMIEFTTPEGGFILFNNFFIF